MAGQVIIDIEPILETKNPLETLTLTNQEVYPMTSSRRGLCLIVLNQFFDDKTKDREGADRDALALAKCFTDLSFDVQLIQDYTAIGIRDKIKSELAKYPHHEADAVCVCISTHGEQGCYLLGKDVTYHLDRILELFSDECCPELVGKPKLFFIQACRGDDRDPGTRVQGFTAAESQSEQFLKASGGGGDTGSETDIWFMTSTVPRSYNVTNMPDFLIAYSTVPGYVSYRDLVSGSWFIEALASCLLQRKTDEDLLRILTNVSLKLAHDYKSIDPNNKTDHKKKQAPCIHSTLTRLVFFPVSQASRAICDNVNSGSHTTTTVDHMTLGGDEVDTIDMILQRVSQIVDGQTASTIPKESKGSKRAKTTMLMHDVDAKDYNIDRVGRCLIINNQKFHPRTKLCEAKGFKKDAQDLMKCFDALEFTTHILTDPTVDQIRNQINIEVKEAQKGNEDVFCLCILTYGLSGDTLWAHDKTYSLESVVFEPFRGDRCKGMAGRPKLFFIQASRCDKPDPSRRSSDAVDRPSYYRIPAMADYLIAYSNVSEYYSLEDPCQKGSWFVQSLVAALSTENKDYLSNIMTTVCRLIFQNYAKNERDKRVVSFD